MKPNKRKWEELLDDANLEKRITNISEKRFRSETNRNQKITAFAFMFLFSIGIFTYTNYILPTDELTSNVSMLMEEFDSNPFLYLGSD